MHSLCIPLNAGRTESPHWETEGRQEKRDAGLNQTDVPPPDQELLQLPEGRGGEREEGCKVESSGLLNSGCMWWWDHSKDTIAWVHSLASLGS